MLSHGTDTTGDGHPTDTDIGGARGLLMLSPLLMLSHGTDTTGDGHPTDTDIGGARGLLMLSPLLMPKLSHGITADTDMDGQPMEDTDTVGWARGRLSQGSDSADAEGTMADLDTDTTAGLARGLLILSPLLMPRLSHGIMADYIADMVDTDTADTDGHTTAELKKIHTD